MIAAAVAKFEPQLAVGQCLATIPQKVKETTLYSMRYASGDLSPDDGYGPKPNGDLTPK